MAKKNVRNMKVCGQSGYNYGKRKILLRYS